MSIPSWILSRIPSEQKIEKCLTGSAESPDEDGPLTWKIAALVATDKGLYFLARAFFTEGFSIFKAWEDFPSNTIVFAETTTFGVELHIKWKDLEFILKSHDKEAHQLVSYISIQLSSHERTASPSLPSFPSDILESVNQLSQLYEKGVLTKREFEIKKASLLKRL